MLTIISAILIWIGSVWLATVRRQLQYAQISKIDIKNSRAHVFRMVLHYKAAAVALATLLQSILVIVWVYISARHLTVGTYLLVTVIALSAGLVIVRKGWLAELDERLLRVLLLIVKRGKKPLEKIQNKLEEKTDLVQRPYDNRDFRQFVKSLDRSDNLISKRYLRQFEKEFELENKTVEDIMVPFAEVKVVDEEDYVGPVLLDELHASRLQIFPVARDGQLIGTVDLADLKEHEAKAKVKQYMRKELNHISDQTTVIELEEAFVEYQSQQFIVIDDKGQPKGVVNIYQLLALHT